MAVMRALGNHFREYGAAKGNNRPGALRELNTKRFSQSRENILAALLVIAMACRVMADHIDGRESLLARLKSLGAGNHYRAVAW